MQWCGEVLKDIVCCDISEASKDILCAPVKICCPCCPAERVLDPVYLCICCPCICVARYRKSQKEARIKDEQEKKAQEEDSQGQPPPVNEIDRMNRAMYETPADGAHRVPKVQKQ